MGTGQRGKRVNPTLCFCKLKNSLHSVLEPGILFVDWEVTLLP